MTRLTFHGEYGLTLLVLQDYTTTYILRVYSFPLGSGKIRTSAVIILILSLSKHKQKKHPNTTLVNIIIL